jgi:predicted ATP-binding protein involved in virulence
MKMGGRNIDYKVLDFTDKGGNIKNFNVIIGDNGVGKTAILEAITKCFVPAIRYISNEAVKKCDITNSDIKYKCGWTTVKAILDIDGENYNIMNRRRISSNINFDDNMDNKVQKSNLYAIKGKYEKCKEKGKLPLVLYYGINRVFNEIPKRGHIIEYKIEDSLKECFDNTNYFRDFYEWFKTEEDIELRELRENKDYVNIQLDSVREAVSSMIKGYSNLRIKVHPSRMVITNASNEELKIEQLSGGYKAILSVIADIAKRLAMANPVSSNPLKEKAVILIDELDLHLHPKWQKKIVEELKRTFPNCQFIVSTHSPFIVQSLKQEELINIEEDDEHYTEGSFQGWSIEDIQEYKMNVETKTEMYKKLMKKFTDAVDDDNVEEVKKLYINLTNILRPESQEKKLIDIDMRTVE